MAVRTTLGAGRGQIARQFLVESLMLGLAGGSAGLGLAFGGMRLLTWMGPDSLPRLREISMDPTVLTFTLGISLLSGALFGLFPVLRDSGLDLVASLKEGASWRKPRVLRGKSICVDGRRCRAAALAERSSSVAISGAEV